MGGWALKPQVSYFGQLLYVETIIILTVLLMGWRGKVLASQHKHNYTMSCVHVSLSQCAIVKGNQQNYFRYCVTSNRGYSL